MNSEELKQHLLAQQQQMQKLSSLINTLSETSYKQTQLAVGLQQQILGVANMFNVFSELVMSASPEIKHFVGVATSQILARPDATGNETSRQMIQALHTAATSAPRTTPEGRRANFQVLPGGEPGSET